MTSMEAADEPVGSAGGERSSVSDGLSGADERPGVAVCIVTRDAAADLPGCLTAVAALDHRPLEVAVVDNASRDGSAGVAAALRPALTAAGIPLMVDARDENPGFAAGMNRALELTAAPWVLSLNADARPDPSYVTRLLDRAAAHPELLVAAVTGRLEREPVSPPPGEASRFAAEELPRLDACGMWLTRSWRHLDRGSGEVDRGQLAVAERVFGATGAASLFSRRALADAAVDGEVFDPRFHSFREDAELAFRLRERGWEVLYEPAARAVHRRWNLPERRRAMPAEVNRHSLKNRYLLRFYHQTAGNFWRTLPRALARDLAALGYALVRERSSLSAYAWLWRQRADIRRRRRSIQARRTLPAAELDRWFGCRGRPL